MKNKLRPIRLSQGKTLKEAAKVTGMSIVQMSRLEKNQRPLTLEVLLDLCTYYKVSVDQIIDVPISNKNKPVDEMLMDTVLGYLVEANDRFKVKADARQINKWAISLYNNAVELRLTPKQIEGLAYAAVSEPAAKGPLKLTGKTV